VKKTILMLLLLIPAAGLLAQAVSDTDVIARSGDVTITKAELEMAVESLPAEYQQYAEGPGKRSFAEDLLRMKMLADAAEKSGLAAEPKVRMQLALARANTLANAQIERLSDQIEINEERVKALYEERKGELDRARARHILIAFEGSPAAGDEALSEEEARAKAERLRARIEAGEDFAEIAREESEDHGSAARGGDLGTFSRGRMVPEFEEAVFSAEAGEVTPVVRTQFGYHVIQVQERGPTPIEEVREQLENELRQRGLQDALESLQEGAEVQLDEAYFGNGGESDER
jgi:peptidyl-prolyl cis-trans isomerase C